MSMRKVRPGEVDHEIDQSQLDLCPVPVFDEVTTRTCDRILNTYCENGCPAIPRYEFRDVPCATFLDYAGQNGFLLAGDPSGSIAELAPIILSRNLLGWDRPRHLAFTRAVEAILPAITDTRGLAKLGRDARSTVAAPFGDPDRPSQAYYYGFDYRALSGRPWRCGTVYLYRKQEFPDDLWAKPFLSDSPLRPVAKVEVEPQDWPLLSRIAGMDPEAQDNRMGESFVGFPWREDDAIHPGRWKREPASIIQKHMDANPDEPIDLKHLGRLVYLSPSSALRVFRAVNGQSPREYSVRQRLARAKDNLQSGKTTGQSAIDHGFADQSHFTAQFRRVYGLTPGAYLRMQESPIS